MFKAVECVVGMITADAGSDVRQRPNRTLTRHRYSSASMIVMAARFGPSSVTEQRRPSHWWWDIPIARIMLVLFAGAR